MHSVKYKGKEYFFKPYFRHSGWFFIEFYEKSKLNLIILELEKYKKLWRSENSFDERSFSTLDSMKGIITDEIEKYFKSIPNIDKFEDWDGNLTPEYDSLKQENEILKERLKEKEIKDTKTDNEKENRFSNIEHNKEFLDNEII